MLILYSWLAEFVNRLPEAAELARALTERGVEAELLIPLQPAVANLTIGRVTGQSASKDEQLAYSVEVNGVTLGWFMAFTFYSYNMDQNWFETIIFRLVEGYFQFRDIMSVNRPHIGQTKLFPYHCWHKQTL